MSQRAASEADVPSPPAACIVRSVFRSLQTRHPEQILELRDVAVLVSGDVAIVGATPLESGSSSGSAYVFDLGQIVGEGSIHGESHAFLLTPVPEPAFGLGLIAAAVLAAFRRTRGSNGRVKSRR